MFHNFGFEVSEILETAEQERESFAPYLPGSRAAECG